MLCAQDAQPTATITCTMDRQGPRIPTKDSNSSLWTVPRPVRRGLQDLLAVAFVDSHWRNIWWIYWKPGEFLSFLFKCLYATWLYTFRLFPIYYGGVKKLYSVQVSNYLFFYASIIRISFNSSICSCGAVTVLWHFQDLGVPLFKHSTLARFGRSTSWARIWRWDLHTLKLS